ncbi:thiamine ABC transporter substrate binding subunit [Limnohabitans sp.]|jgi:thiamine transport system substrate-binding protein|uniref:thiamine ABC transporter substrate binding subunit n=1 Tax=Limnohabitans sp. TaxID=1907725 RepID=UPI0037BF4632
MQHRFLKHKTLLFSAVAASVLCAGFFGWGIGVLAQSPAPVPIKLRVMTHSSFELPKPLLVRFEQEAGVQLQLIQGGDAGELLNKLILSQAAPVADVVYGIDNSLLPRALASGILAPFPTAAGSAALRPAQARMAESAGPTGVVGGLVPINYGYVNLNIDTAWFAQKGLALPQSLQDLSRPAYRGLLVVPHPATSSPGQAFMLATVAGLGEQAAFEWWARMRTNGVKVVKGWSEAYYTEFSRNGGSRPIVVSYATSPAAEVFFSQEKVSTSPTANLFLPGGVFRQVEAAALLQKASPAAQAAGVKFIEFLRSPEVQLALQTSLWMYPAEPGTPRHAVMQHAQEPLQFETMPLRQLTAQAALWQRRWTQVVLK